MKECSMFCGKEECVKNELVFCPICGSGHIVYSNSDYDLMCTDCGELFNEDVH